MNRCYKLFKATDVKTGEILIGTSEEIAKKIGSRKDSLLSRYKKGLIDKTWKIEQHGRVLKNKKLKKELSNFEKKKLKELEIPENRHTIVALWDSYTSGRSDMFSLVNIATEFSVTVSDIERVLQEEGVQDVHTRI